MPINTHPFTNEEVMAYLDGELPAEMATEMKTHLVLCRACQDLAADLQGVSRQIAGWSVETVETEAFPLSVVEELRAREEKASRTHNHVRPWRFVMHHPWAVAAAAILVLVPSFLWISADRNIPHRQMSVPVANSSFSVASDVAAEPLIERKARVNSSLEPGPLVERNAELNVTARNFDTVRTDLDRILLQFGGHIAQLNLSSPADRARRLRAILQVPSQRLDAALAELRKLGRVDSESMRGEEVTQQSVDLEARLKNLRHTEERLTQILATRTGQLSDVLEVEQKIAEVRGQIEQSEAEQKSLNNRITFALVSLTVGEDYRVPLAATTAPDTTTRISNAAVRGLHNVYEILLGLLLVILRAGPSILMVGALLGLPGYFLWKHLRHR